jgi:hypothetical protein
VPWLPETYTGGAAARLQFHWSFAVPFTELLVRPFSRYPIQVLQVVWDNRRIAATNKLSNPDFVSGTAYWSFQGSPGASVSYPATGGWSNKSFASIVLPSGRAFLTATNYAASGTEFAFHLTGKVWRSRSATVSFQVVWNDPATGTLRTDSFLPTVPCEEWFEVSKLFIAPSGWVIGTAGSISLSVAGSGSVYFTEARFAPVLGSRTVQEQSDLESDSLTVALDNANGTDLWMVLAQPHYEFLQVALPEGELTSQQLWQEVRLAAEAKAAGIQQVDQLDWQIEAGDPGSTQSATAGGRLLARSRGGTTRRADQGSRAAAAAVCEAECALPAAHPLSLLAGRLGDPGAAPGVRAPGIVRLAAVQAAGRGAGSRADHGPAALRALRSGEVLADRSRGGSQRQSEAVLRAGDVHFIDRELRATPPTATSCCRRSRVGRSSSRAPIETIGSPFRTIRMSDRERVWNVQTRLTSGIDRQPAGL